MLRKVLSESRGTSEGQPSSTSTPAQQDTNLGHDSFYGEPQWRQTFRHGPHTFHPKTLHKKDTSLQSKFIILPTSPHTSCHAETGCCFSYLLLIAMFLVLLLTLCFPNTDAWSEIEMFFTTFLCTCKGEDISMHKDVQQHPRSCWEVSRTQQASWICDWGLLFCQTLTVEKRIHFKLKGITKIKLLEQDEKIEQWFWCLISYFLLPQTRIHHFRKKKRPSSTANLAQGLGFPSLIGWAPNALVWVWASISFLCIDLHSHTGAYSLCTTVGGLLQTQKMNAEVPTSKQALLATSHICVSPRKKTAQLLI